MEKKEIEEKKKVRDAEILRKWEEQRKTAQREVKEESEKYYSDSEYRKQKDRNTENQNRILYAIFIIMLIAGFFSMCIKPLLTEDKDPDKTEYEHNKRLRLN